MDMRTEFLNNVAGLLAQRGFIRAGDEYKQQRVIQTGHQVMIINGVRHDIPGQRIPIDFIVRALGTGTVESPGKIEEFEQFAFRIGVHLNGQYEERGMDVCIYYDEPEEILTEINQIFAI